MSRISRLRSMTLTLSRLSRLFCWAGLSSSSATRTSKPVSELRLGQLLGLALAHVPVRVDVAAVLPLRAHDVGARRGRQRGELGQAVVGGPAFVGAGVDGDEEGLLDGRGEVDGLTGAHGVVRIPAGGVRASRSTKRSRRSTAVGVGSAAASMTSSDGSRRNQVRWRRANWAFRCASSSMAASSVELAVEHRPALAVADGREGRQAGVVPLAQGPRLLDEAGVELRPRPDARCGGDARPARGPAAGRGPAPGSRRRRAAARPRGASRSPGHGRRAGGCGGRSARRGSAPSSPAAARGRRGRRRPDRARSPPGRPRPTGARPCRGPPSRPAARTRSRRRGSRRRRGRRATPARRARGPGTRPR